MARYWVGGTGNWSDATNHWATTSGGAPGAGNLPTATDDVVFDTLSNATAYTVTMDATTKLCRDITFAAPLTGNMTLTGSTNITCSGSWTFYSGLIRNWTGQITFNATSGTKVITSAGVSFGGSLFLNGSGGTFQLGDDLTLVNQINFVNTAGTFDANGKTVNLNGPGHIIQPTSAITFYNLNYTPTSPGKSIFLTISGGNITVSNLFTLNSGATVTNRILVQSNTIGTARTITSASNSFNNADFMDITGAGAASWNLSAITGLSGDCGGNSGITFTSPVTTDCSAGTTWSTATWSSRVPLSQDSATFSGSGRTITQDMPRIGSVDFTGSSGLTWTTSLACSVFGSINLTNLSTLTASTQGYTFQGRSTYTLTSAGKTWAKSITLTAPSGTLTLLDNFVQTGNISVIINNGTFDANDFNVTTSHLTASGTGVRTISMGNGTWTILVAGSGGGEGWNTQTTTNLTFNAEGSTIKFTDSTNTAGNHEFGGLTYNNVWFSRGASTGNITCAGSCTFNDFKDDGSIAHSILFTAGTTKHFTTFTVSGLAGQLITINSTTTATHALVKDGGGTISCDYLNIQHSVATPSSTWYAGVNSTNNQAVSTAGSGWTFTDPPPPVTRPRTMSLLGV